jgi:Helix-turn-helix domain
MGGSARTVADSMKPGDRSYNLVVRMSLFSNNHPQIARPPIKLPQMDDWLRQVHGDPKLPASAKNVASIIALHVNRKKGMAWPSVPTIAKQTTMSRRTV